MKFTEMCCFCFVGVDLICDNRSCVNPVSLSACVLTPAMDYDSCIRSNKAHALNMLLHMHSWITLFGTPVHQPIMFTSTIRMEKKT